MLNRFNVGILFLLMLLISLTACNRSSEIKVKKIDLDNPKVYLDQPIDPSHLSLGNGIYQVEGIKKPEKFHIQLNYFSDGIKEELATTDSFSTEDFEEIYFLIDEGNVDVLTNNKNVLKNILHFELESNSFPKDNLNAWHWLEESSISNKGSTVIFTYYSQEGDILPTPELNDVDIEKQLSENKELKGIFLELKLDTGSSEKDK